MAGNKLNAASTKACFRKEMPERSETLVTKLLCLLFLLQQ